MKYILILWYLVTPELGASVTGSGFEEMPNVHGAAIEQLDYEKVVVILARFDTKEVCEDLAINIAANYLWKVHGETDLEVVMLGCFQDPKP